ncbi:glutamate/tyrosine decarboxylase-like PLP-dependent enzyme [Ruminiclostridium sufflavum DSM 19573]|uniref:Glutamate/tyrosine decarboxylase-like PLP-dependent enzyme n=1 Tax=Ruminiclostridium sufflavum DSM 19573 TaxID=1121337 RepID=A0A318XRE1_9FIRM|nr:pyridoxal-dependent decarboxylase [Ruminiclostridium sufflavum]PYG90219.1 glutamate/tyrosine decarboxylase-like PLP-dependent enzyme [Ruminiclostridium sufflavum DSM 19573]
MKGMSNILKYFQDPNSKDINRYIDMIKRLDSFVGKHVDTNKSRLNGEIECSYYDYLKECRLSYESKDPTEVFEELSELFKGAVRWNNPGTMININPPANLPAAAAGAYTMFFNPNFAQDMLTGNLIKSELETCKYLAELAGWDWESSQGIFTFGGKSTVMYAVKVGLQKCSQDIGKKGAKEDIFVVSTSQGHPCHAEVCDWLGIGKDNCLKMPVDEKGRIAIEESEKIISERIESGGILACILANGGTTIQMTVDPIKEVTEMRDRLARKFSLNYLPHVHVDSVIGWTWLFFEHYDFEKNPLGFDTKVLTKIRAMFLRVSQITYADSFAADFHKTGFCPYVASVFMSRDKTQMYGLGNVEPIELNELEYGNYSPFQYTLELSRAGTGPVSALTTLKCFGYEGFQKVIGSLMTVGEYIKAAINENSEFEVINNETEGFVTLFIIRQPGENIKYKEISDMDSESAARTAEYNYYFYLYLIDKQAKGECTFVLDYSEGYDKTKSGVKIGVLKAFPMSPLADAENMRGIINELFEIKKEYDLCREDFSPCEVLHKPRAFVCR